MALFAGEPNEFFRHRGPRATWCMKLPNLVMTNSSPWYRWPIYRNRWFTVLNSMVDLSMALPGISDLYGQDAGLKATGPFAGLLEKNANPNLHRDFSLQRKATSKIINHQRSSSIIKVHLDHSSTRSYHMLPPFWGWLKAKATSQSCGFVPQRLEQKKTFGMSLDSISWCILLCIIHPYMYNIVIHHTYIYI